MLWGEWVRLACCYRGGIGRAKEEGAYAWARSSPPIMVRRSVNGVMARHWCCRDVLCFRALVFEKVVNAMGCLQVSARVESQGVDDISLVEDRFRSYTSRTKHTVVKMSLVYNLTWLRQSPYRLSRVKWWRFRCQCHGSKSS